MEQFRELPIVTQCAMALLIVAGLYVHARRFNVKFALDGPAIFTTGGIFFTFLGIASGLLNFDANNIEASVPALLGVRLRGANTSECANFV